MKTNLYFFVYEGPLPLAGENFSYIHDNVEMKTDIDYKHGWKFLGCDISTNLSGNSGKTLVANLEKVIIFPNLIFVFEVLGFMSDTIPVGHLGICGQKSVLVNVNFCLNEKLIV